MPSLSNNSSISALVRRLQGLPSALISPQILRTIFLSNILNLLASDAGEFHVSDPYATTILSKVTGVLLHHINNNGPILGGTHT